MTETPPDINVNDWVGRSESALDTTSHSAHVGLAALLNRTAANNNRLHPLAHWLQFTPTAPTGDLGRDGHPVLGGFMPPLGLPRRMWAGSRVAFHSPVHVGQELKRTTTITGITPKTGSSGPLCFVELLHEIRADEIPAITDRQTIVYREDLVRDASAPSAARPPRADIPAPEGWEWSRSHRPDEATLFRYSALTFNTHRIHYDHPYATGVEGYPGLVVHGPLMATLMVDDFLQARPQANLVSFEFSARAPVFAGEKIHVVGRPDGVGGEKLAIINPDGEVSLTARIEYR